jgi:shikimate dehydrogenase
MTRYFTFVGVTTRQSSIMRIFPVWRDLLGLGTDVDVEGIDLPIHAEPARYREVVKMIKRDPARLGGLVTTHKIDLYHAARDLFDEVDSFASLCGEVSCIAKRDGRLLGWAKDPISAGRSLDRILGRGYFGRVGGYVLCFGAGGAGVAITLHLATRADPSDRPARIVVTNRGPDRLTSLESLHRNIGGHRQHVEFEYVQTSDPSRNDALMAGLPVGSIVINGTGMGKDSPGSPVTDAGVFPEKGIAWELNYRGDLDFLYQAWRQRQTRSLRVEDGWDYFIHGWTSILEEVFQRPISNDDLARLSEAAAFARPHLPTTPTDSAER